MILLFTRSSLLSIGLIANSSLLANSFYDTATVIESTPIVKVFSVSEPRQECWDEVVTLRESGRASMGVALTGAVVGAAIGHHMSNHHRGGALLGAVIGANVARESSRGHDHHRRHVERRCANRYIEQNEERVVGYQVIYRYNGETYSTEMTHRPERHVRVRVSVEAVP